MKKLEFKEIQDLKDYVKNRETNVARKIAFVHALKVKESTLVETVMKDGHQETINVANPGDYIVTNPSGEDYVIKEQDFNNRYELVENDKYRSIGNPVTVCQISENISFMAPWGEMMNIKKGGYLVINSPDDIYGIQEAEFNETYEILN